MQRRTLLKGGLLSTAALTLPLNELPAEVKKMKHNFTFCLNTSTIRQQNLGLMGELKTAAKAGFNGIEIWINTLEKYVKDGGKLSEVKKVAKDEGIVIEDAIGFAAWIVDDDDKRNKALEQMKREMGLLAEIGCKRIAAPPFGATNEAGLNLYKAAERYAKILDLGKEMGVLPQLELWGFSKNLHLFGETLLVATESGHPEAVILPDVYHLRRGGSSPSALQFVDGSKIQMIHINDYPQMDDREKLTDAMRVMPGDGVAPLKEILQILNAKKTPIALSLEIFNEGVWKMDAKTACELGITKMKKMVEMALA